MDKSAYLQIRVMRNILIGSTIIMLLKFVAYFLTHSDAILSDALESIINVVAGSFAYYSLWLAAKPKDIDHPYGHGKIEFISVGFEGGLILLAGLVIVVKSVFSLLHPVQVERLDWGAAIAAIAGGANFVLGHILIKNGKKHQSLTLIADGKHLQSDTWSSLGLVVGVILIYITGWLWLDAVLAILFAGVIMLTGYTLVRKSLAGLMDESDQTIIEDVVQVLNTHRASNWIDIHNLRILQYGSSYHIDCHITLPWYRNLHDSHQELKNVEDLITVQFNRKVELFIHPDPCLPESCAHCSIHDCKVRQHPFVNRIEWTAENVMRNAKHGLGAD